MRAIFIRHGESTGNVDIPASDHSQIALTERGHTQAVAVAETWTDRPELIALSPYLRTHLTAEPTIQRFPDVPVEVLPMQEFTYLKPSRWNGTSRNQRLPHIEAYWKAADPDYCDGPGAEAFSTLLVRVATTLARLVSSLILVRWLLLSAMGSSCRPSECPCCSHTGTTSKRWNISGSSTRRIPSRMPAWSARRRHGRGNGF